ncbi:MAG: hypothetical protein ACJATA_002101 [Sphingobacteriales bacterium]|jgi:hypothetical protein
MRFTLILLASFILSGCTEMFLNEVDSEFVPEFNQKLTMHAIANHGEHLVVLVGKSIPANGNSNSGTYADLAKFTVKDALVRVKIDSQTYVLQYTEDKKFINSIEWLGNENYFDTINRPLPYGVYIDTNQTWQGDQTYEISAQALGKEALGMVYVKPKKKIAVISFGEANEIPSISQFNLWYREPPFYTIEIGNELYDMSAAAFSISFKTYETVNYPRIPPYQYQGELLFNHGPWLGFLETSNEFLFFGITPSFTPPYGLKYGDNRIISRISIPHTLERIKGYEDDPYFTLDSALLIFHLREYPEDYSDFIENQYDNDWNSGSPFVEPTFFKGNLIKGYGYLGSVNQQTYSERLY